MAHQIDMSNGKANVAAVGGAKSMWHGLGEEILPKDSMDTIAKKAGLNFTVEQAPVQYKDKSGKLKDVPDTFVNFRSDTGASVGIVSKDYKIVQPKQVLSFFKEACDKEKLSMETAGALRGGSTVWALAKLGKDYDFILPGNDHISSYLRMQTAFDGTRATDALATYIRQVCANTEDMINRTDGKKAYRVPHTTEYHEKELQKVIGLMGKQHKMTSEFWNALIKRKVKKAEVEQFICDIFGVEDVKDRDAVDVKTGKPIHSGRKRNMMKEIEEAFNSGPGSSMKSAQGTAYGLLQAVTYWTDHLATSNDVHKDGKSKARVTSAAFGLGMRTKADAQYLAAKLAGCVELVAPEEKVAVAA